MDGWMDGWMDGLKISEQLIIRGHRAECHIPMNVNALGSKAILALVDEDTTESELLRMLELSILQHNERVFASELEHHRRQLARGSLHDSLAGRRRADEENLGDVRAATERRTGITSARQQLDQVGVVATASEGCSTSE